MVEDVGFLVLMIVMTVVILWGIEKAKGEHGCLPLE